jgi:hypothetical protein
MHLHDHRRGRAFASDAFADRHRGAKALAVATNLRGARQTQQTGLAQRFDIRSRKLRLGIDLAGIAPDYLGSDLIDGREELVAGLIKPERLHLLETLSEG